MPIIIPQVSSSFIDCRIQLSMYADVESPKHNCRSTSTPHLCRACPGLHCSPVRFIREVFGAGVDTPPGMTGNASCRPLLVRRNTGLPDSRFRGCGTNALISTCHPQPLAAVIFLNASPRQRGTVKRVESRRTPALLGSCREIVDNRRLPPLGSRRSKRKTTRMAL